VSAEQAALELFKANGGSFLIAGAILYLGIEVRALKETMQKVLPKLDDHAERLAIIETTLEVER
jgi:hypothetical protein